MKYKKAKEGRIFVLRLEDGDILHECIEIFAENEKIAAASVIFVGGVDAGSRLVVGPEEGRSDIIKPMIKELEDVYEAAGTGTLFRDESDSPVLHMHCACGREGETVTGCVRSGVKIWHIGEVVVREICETSALRKLDKKTGFNLLEV